MVRQEDSRFIFLKTKILVFSLFSVSVTVAVIFLIGMDQGLFTSKYELHFTVPKGTGFNKGMPVKLSGFRIGRIRSISLNESATVDILVQVDRKYQKWLRKDSTAKLLKEGLIGENIIEVTPGSPEQPKLEEGDELTFVHTKGLDEMAEEIAEKVKPVLIDIKDIITYVNDPEGDLKQSLSNIHSLTVRLEDTRQRLDQLIVSTENQIEGFSGELTRFVSESSQTVEKADLVLTAAEKKFPVILETTERTMRNAEMLSENLKNTAEANLPRVPRLLTTSQKAMDGSGEVVQAVREIWPIRTYLRTPEEVRFVPGDSHD